MREITGEDSDRKIAFTPISWETRDSRNTQQATGSSCKNLLNLAISNINRTNNRTLQNEITIECAV